MTESVVRFRVFKKTEQNIKNKKKHLALITNKGNDIGDDLGIWFHKTACRANKQIAQGTRPGFLYGNNSLPVRAKVLRISAFALAGRSLSHSYYPG